MTHHLSQELYFHDQITVVYHWAGGQLLQPLYLERRRNPNRRYFDKKRDRWDFPYYEQIRTPWFLNKIRITDLSPKVRTPGQFGQYTLPADSLVVSAQGSPSEEIHFAG